MARRAAVQKQKPKYPPNEKESLSLAGKRQKYPQQIKEKSIHLNRPITPRTPGQEFYLNTLRETTITICSGPAGCGKTWLVTAVALEKLLSNQVEKIVVTKPILEAGDEQLGLLPGDVSEKVLPHFQSILDCFEDHLGPTATKKLLADGKIVFLPTAYCRGRNISFSYMIIDEAQNLTKRGIKLLMTRIGEGTMMAINGDTKQVDLPRGQESGLQDAISALTGKHPEISIVELRTSDIQRHPLISIILDCLR